MLDFVGRILGQNPYLYAMIQMENPEVIKVHDAFLEECHNTSEMIKKHDLEGFHHEDEGCRHSLRGYVTCSQAF
jgi:prephenate dehydrogenase